jgi:hypothetical protein
LGLQECLFDDLLPKTLVSSPISSIENTDNIWIACSCSQEFQIQQII